MLDKIKAEIQKVLDAEGDSENARAQALALFWVLELIDKYAEQEPCDDAVSRQAVLEIAKRHTLTNDYLAIQNLPSVRPKEQTGKWILKRTFPTKLYDEYLNEYKCSECYREIRCTESQLVNYPYCHCGAKMVEPQESEDKG